MPARREIEVEATPEEVWEALTTDEGRERWLEDDHARDDVICVAPRDQLEPGPRGAGRRHGPVGSGRTSGRPRLGKRSSKKVVISTI